LGPGGCSCQPEAGVLDESDVESTTASSTVVVAWPSPSSGFKLQFNADLNTTNWTDVGQMPAVVGGKN
jgi:hypothetical protein